MGINVGLRAASAKAPPFSTFTAAIRASAVGEKVAENAPVYRYRLADCENSNNPDDVK